MPIVKVNPPQIKSTIADNGRIEINDLICEIANHPIKKQIQTVFVPGEDGPSRAKYHDLWTWEEQR